VHTRRLQRPKSVLRGAPRRAWRKALEHSRARESAQTALRKLGMREVQAREMRAGEVAVLPHVA